MNIYLVKKKKKEHLYKNLAKILSKLLLLVMINFEVDLSQ